MSLCHVVPVVLTAAFQRYPALVFSNGTAETPTPACIVGLTVTVTQDAPLEFGFGTLPVLRFPDWLGALVSNSVPSVFVIQQTSHTR